MLRLLDADPHGLRLRDLLARFRAQELAVRAQLLDLEAALEHDDRTAIGEVLDGPEPGARPPQGTELQAECDRLAIELVHVRMAVAGLHEEMAEHDRQRFAAARAPLSTPA